MVEVEEMAGMRNVEDALNQKTSPSSLRSR